MAKVQTVTVRAGRKATRDYQTRDYEVILGIELGALDDPKQTVDLYTRIAQWQVDAAMGDFDSAHSLTKNSRLGGQETN